MLVRVRVRVSLISTDFGKIKMKPNHSFMHSTNVTAGSHTVLSCGGGKKKKAYCYFKDSDLGNTFCTNTDTFSGGVKKSWKNSMACVLLCQRSHYLAQHLLTRQSGSSTVIVTLFVKLNLLQFN